MNLFTYLWFSQRHANDVIKTSFFSFSSSVHVRRRLQGDVGNFDKLYSPKLNLAIARFAEIAEEGKTERSQLTLTKCGLNNMYTVQTIYTL